MKIVFAGSPEYAVPALLKLMDAGKEVVAVLTQPDRPTGRKRVLTPTPVKSAASARGIPVYDFPRVRDHADELKKLGADIMITCAYGQILSEEILLSFKGGVWNLHASLLPLYRGASPVQSAILGGESHTGVTVMHTEPDLDSGAILLVKRCEVGSLTCGELSERLSQLSADAALEAVELLERGDVRLLMQDEARATYCKKIKKEDCKIDFSKPAEEVLRLIKAFSPEPAAFCRHSGEILNVFDGELAECNGGAAGEVVKADKGGIIVACGKGAVKLSTVQLAGGKKLPSRELVNGRKIKAGDILD